ncbi:MAG: hypothetical protein KC766_03540 [Myxococcales bacterium]|nr:hypothetical protein [Myxococcales bacterium]
MKLFTKPDAWTGGSYEFALEYCPPSDEALRLALAAIWRDPTVTGCYVHADKEPGDQEVVPPSTLAARRDAIDGRWLGIAILPNGCRVPCSSCIVREEDGSDWLYFGAAMGCLSYCYPVGAFPLDDGGDLSWRPELDRWLRGIAARVYATVPFRLGLVGWIIGGDVCAADLAARGVPQERWEGYLWPESGGLGWYPANQGAPM